MVAGAGDDGVPLTAGEVRPRTLSNVTTPLRDRTLFIAIAAVALLLLGIAAAVLPPSLRRPIATPAVVFGLGGGYALAALGQLCGVTPGARASLLVALCAIASISSMIISSVARKSPQSARSKQL